VHYKEGSDALAEEEKMKMSPFYTKGDSNLSPKYTPDTSSYPKQA